MTPLLTILSAYSFSEALFFIIVIFFLYIIYIKVTDDDYYIETQDIKSKFQARMWEYISGEMRLVESHSLEKVGIICAIKEDNNDTPPDIHQQMAMYSLVLERTLHHTLFETIKTACRVNGFTDMSPEELELYISEKGNIILQESRTSINGKMIYYPILKGTDAERFTEKEAILVYRKIVNKYIRLHTQEKKEFISLKKKYSIWAKINIVGAIITKIKGTPNK